MYFIYPGFLWVYFYPSRLKESWEKPAKLYFNALKGQTNLLFHPLSAGPKGLHDFLSGPSFSKLTDSSDKALGIHSKKNTKCYPLAEQDYIVIKELILDEISQSIKIA